MCFLSLAEEESRILLRFWKIRELLVEHNCLLQRTADGVQEDVFWKMGSFCPMCAKVRLVPCLLGIVYVLCFHVEVDSVYVFPCLKQGLVISNCSECSVKSL